jgi:general secretion pathway protein D
LGFFPGTSPANTIPSSASDQLLSAGLRNTYPGAGGNTAIPALATFTGILTDPQFRVVIKAIDQRSGIDVLSEGDVTTLSGRQCQILTIEMKTIVTGTSQNSSQSGSTAATGTGTTVNPNQAVFTTPITQLLPFGPTIDVVPYVSSDGVTVQMTIIPTLSEFAGYDDPGPFVPVAVTGGGIPITSVLPLPKFRLRQVTTSCIVWDGQTVVLGGLIISEVQKNKDKVPILGDLPLVGKLFQSEASQNARKNLVIFVTPTIIDPAGNRANAEDDLPFNPPAGRPPIPPQAAIGR